jgi:hypothetical protein
VVLTERGNDELRDYVTVSRVDVSASLGPLGWSSWQLHEITKTNAKWKAV